MSYRPSTLDTGEGAAEEVEEELAAGEEAGVLWQAARRKTTAINGGRTG
jgi:hypothetical protein